MSDSVMATYDRENKIWCGEGRAPIYNENESVGELILRSLKDNSEKIVQISDDTGLKVTGNEMRLNSIRVAQNLTKLGYKKDSIVTIISRNHHNLAPLVFGCFLIGAPINALDVSFDKNDIRHMLLITLSNLICCEPCILDKVTEILEELKFTTQIITLGELIVEGKSAENLLDGIETGSLFDAVHFDSPSPKISSIFNQSVATGTSTNIHIDDLMIETGIEEEFEIPQLTNLDKTILAITCSSGTSGLPKGVIITHAQILGISKWHIQNSDTMIAFSSLYWLSGLGILVHGTLKGATRIITSSTSNASLLLRMIQKYRASFIFSSPIELNSLVNDPALETADLSSIKTWMFTGGSLDDLIRIKINKYLKNGMVVPVYGMSELGSIVVSNEHNKEKSVGCLQPEVMAKIIDESNKVLDNGMDGEICIRMVIPFMGYFHDESATSEILDADGWIHTGDIGHFDEEGFLYITDRKKEILKYKGYQISPSDLEKLIVGISGVVMACVVGIPDFHCGELPAAVVVKSPNSSITTNSISETVDAVVADYKKLRGGVYFANAVPLTPSGKIMRNKVQMMAIELYESNPPN